MSILSLTATKKRDYRRVYDLHFPFFPQDLVNRTTDAANKRRDAAVGRVPSPPSESSPEPGSDIKFKPEFLATEENDQVDTDNDDEDVKMEDAQPSQPSQPSRIVTPIFPPRPGQASSAPRAAPFAPPVPGTSTAEAGAHNEDPVQFLLEVFEEILAENSGDTTKVREGTIHSKMYMKCSLKAYHAAKEVTHYYAKRLVASLNPKWYDSPFFQWLKARRVEPWVPNLLKEEEVPGQCVRRKKASNQNQPRASVAGKHFPTGPRPSGKNAALRPGGSSKRPFPAEEYENDDDDDDDDDGRPFKIARTSSDEEDDSDDEEEIEMGSDNTPSAIPYSTTPVPVPVIPKETVRVVVRTERIPSMSPAGVNGTWKCEEEGCGFIVRAARTSKGENLVSEHFKEHTARADKINLALAEGTRGHLPIK